MTDICVIKMYILIDFDIYFDFDFDFISYFYLTDVQNPLSSYIQPGVASSIASDRGFVLFICTQLQALPSK